MTISKSKIKLIKSLQKKKYRKIENLFFCEGPKILASLLSSNYKIVEIFATTEFLKNNKNQQQLPFRQISKEEMSKISALTTPQDVLALVEIPKTSLIYNNLQKNITLALDFIQDPGNLGTIIRIADWFGIKDVVCSSDTTDIYNPKAVQATMGSLFSVNVHYVDFDIFFEKAKGIPVYATLLKGENIYTTELSKNGIVILGNEGKGIRQATQKYITKAITIPSFNRDKQAESLNVAVSAAIVCSEFKRRL